MNFEFEILLELDKKSCMFIVYPQIYDEEGYAELEVEVEVENYVPSRPAPNIKNTANYGFFDDGDNLQADIRLFAVIDNNKTELPTELIDEFVDEFDILDKVDNVGLQKIEDNKLDFQIRD